MTHEVNYTWDRIPYNIGWVDHPTKTAFRVATETVTDNNTAVLGKSYTYASNDLDKYDNVTQMIEGGRKIQYSYLHFENNAKYCNNSTWILNRKTEQKVLDGTMPISITNLLYDALPCTSYSGGPMVVNRDPAYDDPSPSIARGNMNKEISYLLSPAGTVLGNNEKTTKYDIYGNPTVQIDENGNKTENIYNRTFTLTQNSAGLYSVTGEAFQAPNYCAAVKNDEYGIGTVVRLNVLGKKISEWSPQQGLTGYTYENYYFRPEKIFCQGDNEASLTVQYTYQDVDPLFCTFDNPSTITADVLSTIPANPVIYIREQQKQSDCRPVVSPIYRYYDKNGYLKQVKQGVTKTEYQFDPLGRLVSERNPYYENQTTSASKIYAYDELGRLSQVTNQDGTIRKYHYRPLWKSITNENGDSTVYKYDALSRLIEVLDPVNTVPTRYEYNPLDKLTKITMPDGKINTYTYNSLGQLTGKKDPDTDSTEYGYDKVGNMIRYQDAAHRAGARQISYIYDKVNRLKGTWEKNNNRTDSMLLAGNTYDNYDFIPNWCSEPPVPGESLKVHQPVTEVNYTNLNPLSTAIVTNKTINITYRPCDTVSIDDPNKAWLHTADCYWTTVAGNYSMFNNKNLFIAGYGNQGSEAYIGFPMLWSSYGYSTPYISSLNSSATIISAIVKLYQRTPRGIGSTLEVQSCNLWDFPERDARIPIPTYQLFNYQPTLQPAQGWVTFNIHNYIQYITNPGGMACDSKWGLKLRYPDDDVEFSSGDSLGVNAGYQPELQISYVSGDQTPPRLKFIKATNIGINTCDIAWQYNYYFPYQFNDEWTVDTIRWGANGSLTNTISFGDYRFSRIVSLSNLSQGTSYSFQLISRDVTGNRTVSQVYSFTTDSLMLTNYAVNRLTPFSARISFTTNQPANTVIHTGSSSYSFTNVSSGEAVLTGLVPGNRYFFSISSYCAAYSTSTPLLGFRTPGVVRDIDPLGKLTRTQYPGGETVFGYDGRGRQTMIQSKPAGFNRQYEVWYAYDCAGNVSGMMAPDGLFTSNEYDPYGRLSGIRSATGEYLANYTYTASGACSTETFGNGVASAYSYYPRLWLQTAYIGTNSAVHFNHNYGYDLAGNLRADQDQYRPTINLSRAYQYDKLNRLTWEAGAPGPQPAMAPGSNGQMTQAITGYSIGYTYDAMGNRTGSGYSYVTGKNRLRTANGTTYTYTANGNVASDGVWTNIYNSLNKLTSTYKGSVSNRTTLACTYDANGMRIKTVKSEQGGLNPNNNDSYPEPTGDLNKTALAASSKKQDRHDDARDLGTLRVRQTGNTLEFIIGHSYVYGAAQGQYENLYIVIDTDGKMGSGSTWLPEGVDARVTADKAWEYCVYARGVYDYGIYTSDGYKLEMPGVGGQPVARAGQLKAGEQMKVSLSPGAKGGMTVSVPVSLLGNPRNISFTVVSAKPGQPSQDPKQPQALVEVADIIPGGSVEAGEKLISKFNEFQLAVTGASTTVEGFVYDNAGNVICDLDGQGNIVRKYLYNGGKNLAMQNPATQTWTYENNVLYGGWVNDPANVVVPVVSDPAALDGYAHKCSQGAVPGWNCAVWGPYSASQSAGGMYKVTFRLKVSNNTITAPVLWLCGFYHYGAAGQYAILSETQVRGTQFTAANQYQEFEIMVTIPAGLTNMEYRVWTYDRCDIWVDRITVKSMNATTYYYHCDYLGSPRVMTDQSGAVTWRQDYYAFGSDYNGAATGNTHKFTGHTQDAATGQYYAKARYFTTQLGRWSQPEPLLKGVPGGSFLSSPQKLNPYVYCVNNPLIYTDPMGLEEVYFFDQDKRPEDNGEKGTSYTASVYVEKNDGTVSSGMQGSTYPNSTSNTDNSTPYNTQNTGSVPFNNQSGHKGGTAQGLNVVSTNTSGQAVRQTQGTNPNGQNVTMTNVNVHAGTSDNGNYNSRGSQGCLTVAPASASRFMSNFDWSGPNGTTGNSSGNVHIYRGNSVEATVVRTYLNVKQFLQNIF